MSEVDAEFARLARKYLDDRAERHPDAATGLGDHRFDAQLPDPSAQARADERRALDGWAARLAALDCGALAAERLRGIVLSHRDWLVAAGGRTRLRAQWRELFMRFDAVICPVMPTPAFPHDHSADQEQRHIRIDGKKYPYLDQLAWPGIATLPGLPATAIPIGLSPRGLPVGVQIVGPWLEDRTPLKLAELIEREFGGFVPPPMFDD